MVSPPVIDRKYRTDGPLAVQEAAIVRKELAGMLKKLDILENEISRLQHRHKALSFEQRELNTFLEGPRSLLSPARRLLPEILQDIFYHCLPTSHNAVMSIDEALLVLGRVCNRWQQVAYSTPRLWTSIHIVTKLPSFLHDKQMWQYQVPLLLGSPALGHSHFLFPWSFGLLRPI